MNLYLTFDYELFFGEPTGSAEKCILEPSRLLAELASKHQIKLVFFIDVGYILQMEKQKADFPELQQDYEAVTEQVRKLAQDGHDCQLHIHPHWEDCTFGKSGWNMNTSRYKLSDFTSEEIADIVSRYKKGLESLTDKPVSSYRAGGWCVQPFERLKSALQENGIRLDSSVFPGGFSDAGNYAYDFRNAPAASRWSFSHDPATEDPNGDFLEIPIASEYYGPLFFWKLFVLGRLNPSDHKPIGNGYPMPTPGLRKKMLTKGMLLSASTDGYFVTRLNKIVRKQKTSGKKDTVVLGHPKACTRFALKKLDEFISCQKNNLRFTTFSEQLNEMD